LLKQLKLCFTNICGTLFVKRCLIRVNPYIYLVVGIYQHLWAYLIRVNPYIYLVVGIYRNNAIYWTSSILWHLRST